jgi:hypothetical protein
MWVCDFFPFLYLIFSWFVICGFVIFFLRSSVCGCGVVLMVALWEVSGGCGRVTAEEERTSQASLIFLFHSVFIYFFFLITHFISLPFSRGKNCTPNARLFLALNRHMVSF